MRSPWSRFAAFCLVLVALPVAGQDPPEADDLIQRYVEAIGGRDVHLAPSTLRTTGSVALVGLGIQGEFEVVQSLPDKMTFRITIPGIGEQARGFDGEVGWSVNPMVGPMILQGTELDQMREGAHVLGMLRDRQLVPERETVGLAEYEGEACWRVRIVWASGRESFDCYSRESGLLIASEDTQATPMGELPVTTLLSEYREFDGMLLPTRMLQRAMGQEQVIRVSSVEVDSVEPSEMEPPAAIRTLLATGGPD
jgi:hypothetical protein